MKSKSIDAKRTTHQPIALSLFIKRNKLLMLASVVCLFLMIKASFIPYPIRPPAFLALLFDCPKDPFWQETAQLINVIASAFVASMVFYFFTAFLPALKREREIELVLRPTLIELCTLMGQLAGIFTYLESIGKLSRNDDKMACEIKNSESVLRVRWKCGCEPEVSTLQSLNLYCDCDKIHRKINQACIAISGTQGYVFANEELVKAITGVQLSSVIKKLRASTGTPHLQSTGHYIEFCRHDFETLQDLKSRLEKRTGWRYSYAITTPSKEEVAGYEAKQAECMAELEKRYPNSSELRKELSCLLSQDD